MHFHGAYIAIPFLAFAVESFANTPPPPASINTEVCQATHVFVGTASKVHFVNASKAKMCAGELAEQNGALTSCGAAEVEIQVTEVLYPINWTPSKPVIYRFGGGLFSTESLKSDLEGRNLVFHLTYLGEATVRDRSVMLFGPSYPWVLAKQPSKLDQVKQTLSRCAR